MVHATFQDGGHVGKMNRFRENGMWRMDPLPKESDTYIIYNNGVEVEILTIPD